MSQDYFTRQAFAGAPLTGATVIDAHAHLGANPQFAFPDSSVAGLIATMDRIGVQMACVSSIPAIYGSSDRGNAEILAAVAQYPDRLFGYLVVDPGYPERVTAQLARGLARGMRGIKLHSHGGFAYDHPHYQPVYEAAAARSMPLLAHTWSDAELDQLEAHFRTYPQINFLLGHSGAVSREHYVRLGREYDNVFLELCFSVCPRGLVEYFVGEGMARKLLWGSDAIFMSMEQQIGRVVFAQIPEADKRLILGENATRALRLP